MKAPSDLRATGSLLLILAGLALTFLFGLAEAFQPDAFFLILFLSGGAAIGVGIGILFSDTRKSAFLSAASGALANVLLFLLLLFCMGAFVFTLRDLLWLTGLLAVLLMWRIDRRSRTANGYATTAADCAFGSELE